MKLRKIMITAASCLALAIAAVPVVSVSAKNSNYVTYDGTTDSSHTTTLTKYLVMDKGKQVPVNGFEFDFVVEAGDKVEATVDENGKAKTLEVLAGIAPEKVKLSYVDAATNETVKSTKDATNGTSTLKLAITRSDAITLESAAPSPEKDKIQFSTADNSDEQYIKQEVTIDVSGVGFTEPGIYRYYISEPETNKAVVHGYIAGNENSELNRTLDVYVENTDDAADSTGNYQLKVTKLAIYSGKVTGAPVVDAKTSNAANTYASTETGATQAVKSDSISNLYETRDLTIEKKVSGNQASKDKYFRFDVEIVGKEAETYEVDATKLDTTLGDQNVPNRATIYTGKVIDTANNIKQLTSSEDADGKTATVTHTFYLQAGQSVIIKGLEKSTKYKITEYQEDYTPSFGIDTNGDKYTDENSTTTSKSEITGVLTKGSTSAENTYVVSDTDLLLDTTLTFTNTREGTIPTGVIMTVAPYAIGGVVILALIVFLVVRSKKRYEDEEA